MAVHAVFAGFDFLASGIQDRDVTITGTCSIIIPGAQRSAGVSANVSVGDTAIVVNTLYGWQKGALVTIQGRAGAYPSGTYITGVTIGTSTATLQLSNAATAAVASGSTIFLPTTDLTRCGSVRADRC